jgi:integrase/recombinase XerD
MNHNSPGSITLQKAILGFLQAKEAEALSPRTIQGYQQHLDGWLEHMGDQAIAQVTTQDLRAYLAYLRTEYKPKRFNGKAHPISQKTLRNVYITLASFFTWLETELALPNPIKAIPAPKFQPAEIEPFTLEEVESLLKATEYTQEARPHDRRRFVQRRPTALRDRAMVLVLLDTGLRASELCALNLEDVDQKTGKIVVKHGQEGGAKGGKGRLVYLGKAARRALWRYLVTREDATKPAAPLFTSRDDRRLRRDTLLQLIQGLGERAQVKNCHPHRFRHYAEFRTMPS